MSKIRSGSHPKTDEDWMALRADVLELFTPGAPIDEVALFAGRQSQIQKLRDTLASKGRHAVVFGEKGVGKTSIVTIFYLGLHRTSRVHKIYVQCHKTDEYKDIWLKAFKRIKFTENGVEHFADNLFPDPKSADDIEMALSHFGPNDIPLIIFDEFDRVQSATAKALMSETIKHLSNAPIAGIIILVGVASSVASLIAEHASLSRALVQIEMPRMDHSELRELVTSRIQRTPLKITDDAVWRIAYLASGLPFYAHAIGQAAALLAIKCRQLKIDDKIVRDAIPDCFNDLDQTLIDSYVKATVTTRKGNIFKEVVAACALAEQDDLGRFSAASVEKVLSEIVQKEMKAPAFSFHLNELCGVERGLVLEKAGTRSHFRFRFVEPMMQPFVIIKSLSDSVIDDEIIRKFSVQQQRTLPI